MLAARSGVRRAGQQLRSVLTGGRTAEAFVPGVDSLSAILRDTPLGARRGRYPLRDALAGMALSILSSAGIAHGQRADDSPAAERPSAQLVRESENLSLPQGPERLSLLTLEQMAIDRHPGIREALAKLEAACGRWVQVGLPPNPTVGYSGQQLGSRGQAEQEGVLIGQEIVAGRKLRLNRAVAQQEIRQAQQVVAAQQQRVLTDVRTAFYEVLVAERRVALTGELAQIGAKAVDIAKRLLAAREGSRVEILQAQVDADRARVDLSLAENRRDAAWRALAAAAGDPAMPAQPLDGTLENAPLELQWDQVRAHLLAASPELAAASIEVDRAGWVIERAYRERIPNLTVEGVIQRDAQIDSTDGNLQATIPLPLFDRNQGGIRQAHAELQAARRARERTELDLQNRLAGVFERYAGARDQAQRYKVDILPAAAESLELARRGYEAGEFPFLSFLTAQRTYFQTQLVYLDAQRELWLSSLEIEGLLLSGGLSQQP